MQVRFPWESDPPPAETPATQADPTPKPRGRRPAQPSPVRAIGPPAWLYHHLTVSGPGAAVAELAAAARGSGVIPWRLDLAALEEDVFVRAVSQPAATRNLSVAGCRILARQFRERVEARQSRAAALVGRSQACPFDLHTLLPVPDTILQRGPADPASLAWLSAQWGTTDRLRQVVERRPAATEPRDEAVIGYGFFTAGDTPQAAMAQLAARWPVLRFLLQPRPAS
jgi:hypothetical protein